MNKDEALKLAREALENTWTEPKSEQYKIEKEAITAIKEALAQPEQEPVAWWNDTGTHIDLNVSGRGTPLYITPPQRTWVGLTQEEFEKLVDDAGFTRSDLLMIGACVVQIIDLVEAKLKEKNK